jgi:nicotinamide mononucleotide (NMN) deamidase PncC
MAEEARSRYGAELAVSSCAGGQEVYLGLAGPDGLETRSVSLLGNRELVAARASQSALDWLRLVYLT